MKQAKHEQLYFCVMYTNMSLSGSKWARSQMYIHASSMDPQATNESTCIEPLCPRLPPLLDSHRIHKQSLTFHCCLVDLCHYSATLLPTCLEALQLRPTCPLSSMTTAARPLLTCHVLVCPDSIPTILLTSPEPTSRPDFVFGNP